MNNSKSTVLIIQSSPQQRMIWEQVLQSQEILVISESLESDPIQALIQIEQSGNPLPEVLLIEQQLLKWHSENFCKSCRQRYPNLKIIFLHQLTKEILPTERQQIIDYGAFDILPAFQIEALAMGIIVGVKQVLAALPSHPPLQKDQLVSRVIEIKREVENQNLENAILNTNVPVKLALYEAKTDSQSPTLTDTNINYPQPESPPEKELIRKKLLKRSYRGATY